jgi:DNA-binding MarR family transcriptional regulator/N-acetylglutamate synthase-like GNAT family acetyltransferase
MAAVATADRVDAVRAFNRFYTGRIGVLGEFLHTQHSLTEARVLYELGDREVVEVADLRRELDIDAGYLSRLLSRLEEQALVARERSAEDARRQRVRLTEAGRDAFAELDRRSAAEIGELLDGLGEEGQRRLVAAMQVIADVLDEDRPSDGAIVLRAPHSGDYGWIVQRHGALYAEEYAWDETFEALVARIVADYAESHDPKREAAWIAEVDGEPVGCVLCVRKDDETAQLRLLLVDPRARGRGIGAKLIDECLRFARRAGYRRMVLWTNDVLHDARRLYERADFELVESGPHHAFGHDLVEQTWARSL